MLDKLKADFDRIMELVNKTPASLQETAFKMISRLHAESHKCNT
jgi:hypothetical protein